MDSEKIDREFNVLKKRLDGAKIEGRARKVAVYLLRRASGLSLMATTVRPRAQRHRRAEPTGTPPPKWKD